MAYDFSDDAVLQMVKANHRPTELPTHDHGVAPVELACVCLMCQDQWPCPTIQAARRYEKDALRKNTNSSGIVKDPRVMTGPELHAHRIAEGKIVQ